MKRLLVVDGHAYAYRAFHAIRELQSPSGQPTNAIYGFIKMLSKIRERVGSGHLIVVWDGGLSAERMELLPEYKAQRPEMPADLASQLDEIGLYLDAAGVPAFCREGVEADDYIGFLARSAAAAGAEVIIASSDKDFMQLVSTRVSLLNPNDKTETLWTDEQVRAKTGVLPAQIVDWLSLIGDAVDNIPGVPGVGTKTAAELLRTFDSITALYERLEEVKSERLRAALRVSAEAVQRNQKLVRLKEDQQWKFSVEALVVGTAQNIRLAELYRKWGFKSMLAALGTAEARQEALL